jgi:cytochrome oxidase Cu insertion factor (SCO1/SenC/PrrC family)
LLWGVLVVVLVGVGVAWAWSRLTTPPTDKKPVERMPDFTLQDRSGRRISRADLRGRPWVADFIFTGCAGPCPIMSGHMTALQAAFADTPARFVSFSLDPDRDTPAVLDEYADRFDADPDRWFFLTGDHDTIYRIATEGLGLVARTATPAERDDGSDRIIHSTLYVLVDAEGRIAGRYLSTSEADLDNLREDLRTLCDPEQPAS